MRARETEKKKDSAGSAGWKCGIRGAVKMKGTDKRYEGDRGAGHVVKKGKWQGKTEAVSDDRTVEKIKD